LRNYTLGPPLESYGPNVRITVILVVVGLLFCVPVFAVARELRDPILWAVFYVLAALFAGLAAAHLNFRVWLHETGVSFQGIVANGEMRWREIERYYFGSYEIHATHIPLGTFYRLKLVGIHGQKVSLGERIQRADDLAKRVAHFTLEPMLQKAVRDFENGAQIRFGAISVSRSAGVTVRKWFVDRELQWKEIEGYDITDAYFTFHRFGKRLGLKIASERLANVPVLKALLDGVMGQVWQR
jgi:hypothetical protein